MQLPKELKTDKDGVIILPSSELSDEFLCKNKFVVQLYVIEKIEYAVNTLNSSVKIFSIEKSSEIIILTENMFLENLKTIYQDFIDCERYEYCDKILKLIEKIEILMEKYQIKYI